MTTEKKVYQFPRQCSVTGSGFYEGYCFGDGEDYACDEESALILAKRMGYSSLEEAYDDEAYYFTYWEDMDEDGHCVSEHEDGRDAVWVNT